MKANRFLFLISALTGLTLINLPAIEPAPQTASDNPILLRTSLSAGHGIGTALSERFKQSADIYAFLFAQLGMTSEGQVRVTRKTVDRSILKKVTRVTSLQSQKRGISRNFVTVVTVQRFTSYLHRAKETIDLRGSDCDFFSNRSRWLRGRFL
jgi:hypothetical protein